MVFVFTLAVAPSDYPKLGLLRVVYTLYERRGILFLRYSSRSNRSALSALIVSLYAVANLALFKRVVERVERNLSTYLSFYSGKEKFLL